MRVATVVHFEGEAEGRFGRRGAGQGSDARDHVALERLVDEQVQATPFQAFIGEPHQRQIAQAILALVVGRTVVARVADVKQTGDRDPVVLFQRVTEQAAKQRAFSGFRFFSSVSVERREGGQNRTKRFHFDVVHSLSLVFIVRFLEGRGLRAPADRCQT